MNFPPDRHRSCLSRSVVSDCLSGRSCRPSDPLGRWAFMCRKIASLWLRIGIIFTVGIGLAGPHPGAIETTDVAYARDDPEQKAADRGRARANGGVSPDRL